jgi:small multidrug resistance pump
MFRETSFTADRQFASKRLPALVRSREIQMSSLYLAAAILLEICGTTALKLSDGFSRLGPASVVVVCYTASFVVLSWALRGIDLSTAYAVWSGVGTALVAAIGILWFGEAAGIWKLACLALIVIGVAGLNLAGRGS